MTQEQEIINAWSIGENVMNRLRLEKHRNQYIKAAAKPVVAKMNFNTVAAKMLQLQTK